MKKNFLFIILLLLLSGCGQVIKPGAEQTNLYLPLLKNQRVAIFVNRTSQVRNQTLLSFLLKNNINVVKIFVPEHGLDTNTDLAIHDKLDAQNHIPIVSLYGKKLTPTPEDLKNVDILVFDIQDVGVRFYTYISSLQKFMQAAAENKKTLIILDRPNPNGFYIDGPVLEPQFKSFTGMQPIPIVYGMTIGEYANMLLGEKWLTVSKDAYLKMIIIRCQSYTHDSLYIPPIKPSPNLPNIQSIYLYPSIALMESTKISVGRGTHTPFQIYGHPVFTTSFTFIPRSIPGAEKPPYENQICHGWNLAMNKEQTLKILNKKIQLKYLMQAYQLFPNKKVFFRGFNYTAGNAELMQQIQNGVDEQTIRESWQPKLQVFKKIRQKYLLYP